MSGRLAGWRLALRLARREAVRRKGQTALMLVLICLPVLGVGAAAVVWQTVEVSHVEALDREIGSAAALVTGGSAGPVQQHFHPDDGMTWPTDEALGQSDDAGTLTLPDLRRVLGDRPSVALRQQLLTYRTDQGEGDVQLTETDLGDPLTDGLFRQVAGKAAPRTGEVLINQALADRGPGIGDELVLSNESGEEMALRVVGITESTSTLGQAVAVVAPGAVAPVTDSDVVSTSWLLGGGPVTWPDVRAVNKLGGAVTSRAVITDPPPESELPVDLRWQGSTWSQTAVTVLVLVVVMVLIEVVLLAGPAFAVRARKQAHALALIAAAGGTPAQARRVVLATGVVVGATGGVVGTLLGIVIAFLLLPIVQRFNRFEYLGPFDVPWHLLAVVAAFGLVSALLAAVVPAFIASRQDVVAVLAARRGEGRPSARTPYVGLGLLAIGIAVAVVGSRNGSAGALLIGGSAIASVLGMILVVPVAVMVASRLASGLPLPLRFAARDAARHRTRTVPAVAAVAATVAGVVALGIAVASQEAAARASYRPELPAGQGVVALGPDVGEQQVRDALSARLPADSVTPVVAVREELADGAWVQLGFRAAGEEVVPDFSGPFGSVLVGDRIPAVVPMSDAERARADRVLRSGGVVMLAGADADVRPLERVTITQRRHDESGAAGRTRRTEASAAWARVNQELAPAQAVVPEPVVARLGIVARTSALVIDGPIPASVEQDLAEGLAALPRDVYFYVERGYQPDPSIRVLQLILAVLGGVLMLGGTLTATFLALSDARPDLATMAAVGARPRTRRGVAAAYALVVGLVGALVGAPVGFIPGVAISRPLTRDWATGVTVLDLPWLLITVVVLGLPLLTAVAVGLCARSRLPMVARID